MNETLFSFSKILAGLGRLLIIFGIVSWAMTDDLLPGSLHADDPSPASDLEQIRQNALDYWRAVGADRSSPWMIESLASLNNAAEEALLNQAANGSWPDITYNVNIPDTLVPHYERLQSMARAWATEGTDQYQSPLLLDGILEGIDFIQGLVNTGTNLNRGNWWWWQIGIPERYAPTLLLVRPELGSTRLNAAAATLNYLVGTSGPRYAAEGTGNQIWWAMGRIHYGMLADDNNSVQVGATRIADQIRIVETGEEGLMPDMSFQAHEEQLQTGHYGATFIFRTSEFTQLAEGTDYQLDEERFELLGRFLLEGARWVVFHRFYDISSEGRAFTRVERNAEAILNALLIHGNAEDTPAREEAAASARHILHTWDFPLMPEYAGLAARLETAGGPAAMPSGMAVYNYSDYVIQRRENYFISLKTISDRTLIGETWNNENKRGRHLASGVTWIQTADEYRTNHVLPTLDYHRLPGITVENGLNLGVAYHYQPGLRSFVTATSTGQRGSVAMDFQARLHQNDSDLSAQKSWFFFADAMVSLGSGITSTKNRVVETIINQRPMSAIGNEVRVNNQLFSDGIGISVVDNVSSIHEGNVGYIFPAPTTVSLRRANQSGRWSDIGSGDSSTIHSNPMLTLWFNHGVNPTDDRYVYAVLPGVSAAETAAFADQQTLEILAHSNELHAVRHSVENAVGAVFWEPGSLLEVTVDQPSVVFWRQVGNQLTLSVSAPRGNSQPVQLIWPAELSPQSVPGEVEVNISEGQSLISFPPSPEANTTTTWTIAGVLSPAEQWRWDHFGQSENSGDAADQADPDGDGVPNLGERAFATDPNDASDRFTPEVRFIEINEAKHLAITFRRLKDPAAHGLIYRVETSQSLTADSWNDDPHHLVEHSVDSSAVDYDLVTVRMLTPMSANQAAFIRVRIVAIS